MSSTKSLLTLRQWCIQGVLFAVHAAEDMISDFLGAEEGPKGAAGQQAAAGMLLQILQKSAGMHAEVPKQAAIPLGIAILDPLCQLITSMLGLMHSQPAAAQVHPYHPTNLVLPDATSHSHLLPSESVKPWVADICKNIIQRIPYAHPEDTDCSCAFHDDSNGRMLSTMIFFSPEDRFQPFSETHPE